MTPATELLKAWVCRQAGPERGWVEDGLESLFASGNERDLHIFMGSAPRRLGKADLALSPEDNVMADKAHRGWRPEGWSIDGAARILGLLVFRGQRPFAETFKDLRRTADAAELIALYRGLPLYADPKSLDFEVGEGLRSNLKPVFEAIAHDNPYPRDHFDEHRWNHMVLKALFVGSSLAPVIGLDDRANPELARILIEYAEERWAANRPVSPELWRPVAPFADLPEIRTGLDRARAAGHDFLEIARS